MFLGVSRNEATQANSGCCAGHRLGCMHLPVSITTKLSIDNRPFLWSASLPSLPFCNQPLRMNADNFPQLLTDARKRHGTPGRCVDSLRSPHGAALSNDVL